MLPTTTRNVASLLAAMGFLRSLTASLLAKDDSSLTPEQAYEMMQAGKAKLIDIRYPQEWEQTGVAKGALRIAMTNPRMAKEFAEQIRKAVGGKADTPVILICRSGSRTAFMRSMLKQLGFENVYHVSGGMLGRFGATGWIASGLPVEPCPQC